MTDWLESRYREGHKMGLLVDCGWRVTVFKFPSRRVACAAVGYPSRTNASKKAGLGKKLQVQRIIYCPGCMSPFAPPSDP